MKRILVLLIIIISVSCKTETNSNKDSKNSLEKEEQITRLHENEVLIRHNFPDTLYTGDKVKAEIESKNPDWIIIRSFIFCPIGSDNVFRIFRRTQHECLELLVENNKTLIEFTTNGTGNKDFGTVTLVLENKDGIKKATELEFKYFLKDKNGS